MTAIVIVEDNETIRNYLTALLTAADGLMVLAAFEHAEKATAYFEKDMEIAAQLVLTDIQLPGKSGIDLINWLKPLRPDIQFMVLSIYEDSEMVFNALKAGATGYILKSTPAHKLIIGALHGLRDGGSPMSSQIARKVVN